MFIASCLPHILNVWFAQGLKDILQCFTGPDGITSSSMRNGLQIVSLGIMNYVGTVFFCVLLFRVHEIRQVRSTNLCSDSCISFCLVSQPNSRKYGQFRHNLYETGWFNWHNIFHRLGTSCHYSLFCDVNCVPSALLEAHTDTDIHLFVSGFPMAKQQDKHFIHIYQF